MNEFDKKHLQFKRAQHANSATIRFSWKTMEAEKLKIIIKLEFKTM